MEEDVTWMEERIDRVPKANWLYKFCCLFLFRWRKKLTYNEMYLLLYGLNKKALGERDAKRFAWYQIVDIRNFQNNNKSQDI